MQSSIHVGLLYDLDLSSRLYDDVLLGLTDGIVTRLSFVLADADGQMPFWKLE